MRDGEEPARLPLCALGSGAVHGLCVVVLLPMIMLSGAGAKVDTIAIEVEVVTALPPSAAQSEDAAPAESEMSSGSAADAASTDSPILGDETDLTSAFPVPPQETSPAMPDPLEPAEDSIAVIEPAASAAIPSEPLEDDAALSETLVTAPDMSPSVANVEQPVIEPREVEPQKAEAKKAKPKRAAPKKAAPKKAAAAKPKPPARTTAKVQRKVVRPPSTMTTGLQTLFKNLSQGRLNSTPMQARSRSSTGNKTAPAGKGNKANPLYFR